MTTVAIHQPNFFPWLGYFDKLARADVFVFLDAVDFPKSSWVNRVRIEVQGEARWTTCPVNRATWRGAISEVAIDDSKPWRSKLLKTLEANYRRAINYDSAMAILLPLITHPTSKLAEFNIAAISTIASALGATARLVRQSELSCSGTSNELLVSIVRAAGGHCYLKGGGADSYHDEAVFEAAGVQVLVQQFDPIPYRAAGSFVPGLSVIDYLMHDGRHWDRR